MSNEADDEQVQYAMAVAEQKRQHEESAAKRAEIVRLRAKLATALKAGEAWSVLALEWRAKAHAYRALAQVRRGEE